MPNKIFKETLQNRITNCINEAKTIININHQGMAGEVREILISKVLKELLPDGFSIGTGKVADANGNLSKQSDIIIYNKFHFPPILYDESKGIFPIESVAYVIEVKTTLNATEIKTTMEKADCLANLSGTKPHFILFAFNSDLKDGDGDYKRMMKYVENNNPTLNIWCIVERLYGFYNNSGWQVYREARDHVEVIGLIIGILNTLLNWAPRKTNINPGNYFL